MNFREASASDRDAILALRKVAFPDDDPEKQRADFWEWEFRDGYAGPGRVFVAEEDDRLLGHFAFVPQRYEARQPIRAALAVDVMTHPDYRRQKVFSRLARFAAGKLPHDMQLVIAFQIRKAVMGGMAAGGWSAVQELPVLIKPVSLVRVAHDFVLRSAPISASLPLRSIERFDEIDALLRAGGIRQKRTPEFLRWRYLQNPHWSYSIEGLYEEGRLAAFAVHRDTVLRKMRSTAIADAGGSPEPLRRLLHRICAASRERGMAMAAALMSRDHPAYRTLRSAGFFPGPHRFRLLLQVFDDTLRDLGPWSLSWGDTDHL